MGAVLQYLNRKKGKGYFSDAKQDEFVDEIFNHKKTGYFIDIGACDAKNSNNSYHFASKGWKGICIEIESGYASSYATRPNTVFLNQDALNVDWKSMLNSVFGNSDIDYLSIDIDTLSLDFLKSFPFQQKKPHIITIEHDFYIYKDLYRKPQRQLLYSLGYQLLFGDIFVEQKGFKGKNCSFEDWWVSGELSLSDCIFDKSTTEITPSRVLKLLRKCP
jgi:hypothetical protein